MFEQGTLVIGGLTFALKGVVISSLEISGDVLTLELDAASASPKREAKEGEKPQPTPRAEAPPG